MIDLISRRALLVSGGAFWASGCVANAPSVSLRPQGRPIRTEFRAGQSVAQAIAAAKLGGKTGVAVADVATGRMIESHGGDAALPPASVMKAVTALYALDVLGADHRFTTRLIADGPIEKGVLQGNLILVGGGDPLLTTDDLAVMARALRSRGIGAIKGRFLVYGGALPYIESIDGGQPKHVGYSPSISGMCLNLNRVYFEWRGNNGQPRTTMDARGRDVRPPVKGIGVTLSRRAAPVYEYRPTQSREIWSVSQAALGGNGGRWLPVRRPEDYAGEVFRWLAGRHGVSLPRAQKTTSRYKGTVIASHRSQPLKEIVEAMLRLSTNLTAEAVGLTASQARGQGVRSLRASGKEMEVWAARNLGMRGVSFVDHSGLGDKSKISAHAMVGALVQAQAVARLRPLLKHIVLRGADGTPNKAHPVQVHAKTGTLNFVSSLAGYMRTVDGRQLAFAHFSADEATRRKLSRAQRERPSGARGYARRARALQQVLIERWGQAVVSEL